MTNYEDFPHRVQLLKKRFTSMRETFREQLEWCHTELGFDDWRYRDEGIVFLPEAPKQQMEVIAFCFKTEARAIEFKLRFGGR